jgi:demethoxyubiquinone hydroxylase (CLK1/Coq7/Cat5 family)
VLDNAGAVELAAFGETVPGVTEQWQVFMAGAVVAVILMAGVTLALLGIRRSMGIRRELRDLRDEHEESLQTLEMEKRQLQRELAQVRRNAPLHSSTP